MRNIEEIFIYLSVAAVSHDYVLVFCVRKIGLSLYLSRLSRTGENEKRHEKRDRRRAG